MADITAGSLLANRYRLISRAESDLADVAAWQANDQILDRPVRIAIVSGAHAAAALEDARRASLVSDPRIVRVIDAGGSEELRYVVLDAFIGDDLSVLTSGRTLATDQARAIVGEAATALEVARHRGVHHLALRPQAIRVLDGRVQITGLGIDGSLNPGARGASATSARADVVGLLSIFFYATTGTWPFANLEAINASAGVLLPERAQSVDGKPPSLGDLAEDVPKELVELVDRTLSSKTAGPRTPGELVTALEPWGPITVTAPRLFDSVQSFVAAPVADLSELGQAGAVAARQRQDQADDTNVAHNGDNSPPTPAGSGAPTPVVRQSIRSTLNSGGSRVPRPGTPPPAVPTTEPGRVRRQSVLTGAPAAPSPTSPSAASAAESAAPATGPTPTPTPAPSTGPPAWAPVTHTKSAPQSTARPQNTAPPQSANAQGPLKFDELMTTPREYRRFRFNPTALTLILALAAGVVGVPIALSNLSSGFTNPFASETIERPLPPGETAPEEDPESMPAETTTTTTPPIAPVIASGQQLDPQGDENEHPEAVDLAFDQDPSTFWFTRTYQSATFAGLGKDGIGFAVKLEQVAPVSTVYLSTNNTGGNVEVRATDPKDPTKGKVLASAALDNELTLDLSETVEAEHIVLWFTELPSTPDGKNRVELREITLT